MKLRATPPNVISVTRLLVTPVLFALILRDDPGADLAAFLLFTAAALSDYLDGWLARAGGWKSEAGIYLDPAADKLLLASSFLAFYLVTASGESVRTIPHWGSLPLWVVVVVLGRELVVSVAAFVAHRRGAVVEAAWTGKSKSAVEFLFSGSLLLWWVLQRRVWTEGIPAGGWSTWAGFHGGVVAASLAGSLLLAIVSVVVDVPRIQRRLKEVRS